METKEILKKVRKIEIRTRKLSNHLFSGEYHSSFKGRGMAFSEVREYQIGDDVRAIDWNVTARYRKPYVKIFEEERELTMMLVVDISGSGDFGTVNTFKKNLATEIAATLAFSATQNNDKVGLLLFSDQVELFIPPKKGRTHVLRIIRELIEFEPERKQTQLNNAMRYLFNVLTKRSIVFVISDFIDEDYDKTLKMIASKHDLTGIRIYDAFEENLPNIGMVNVWDAELGKRLWADTGSKKVRRVHKERYEMAKAYCHRSFSRTGAGLLDIATTESYVKKLLGYFRVK